MQVVVKIGQRWRFLSKNSVHDYIFEIKNILNSTDITGEIVVISTITRSGATKINMISYDKPYLFYKLELQSGIRINEKGEYTGKFILLNNQDRIK